MRALFEALVFPAAVVTLALLALLGARPGLIAGALLVAAAMFAGVERLHERLNERVDRARVAPTDTH